MSQTGNVCQDGRNTGCQSGIDVPARRCEALEELMLLRRRQGSAHQSSVDGKPGIEKGDDGVYAAVVDGQKSAARETSRRREAFEMCDVQDRVEIAMGAGILQAGPDFLVAGDGGEAVEEASALVLQFHLSWHPDGRRWSRITTAMGQCGSQGVRSSNRRVHRVYE